MRCVAERPDMAADVDFHFLLNIPDGGWTRQRNSTDWRDIGTAGSSCPPRRLSHLLPPIKNTPLIDQWQSPCFNETLRSCVPLLHWENK